MALKPHINPYPNCSRGAFHSHSRKSAGTNHSPLCNQNPFLLLLTRLRMCHLPILCQFKFHLSFKSKFGTLPYSQVLPGTSKYFSTPSTWLSDSLAASTWKSGTMPPLSLHPPSKPSSQSELNSDLLNKRRCAKLSCKFCHLQIRSFSPCPFPSSLSIPIPTTQDRPVLHSQWLG